jgi:2-polyprenyl-3-methyl-5-hydroxy-6-metoxy-1,4-benzoquinol methylase
MMINKSEFTVILKCIHCSTGNLIFNDSGSELKCSSCNHGYVVSENVPVVLPEEAYTIEAHTEIHNQTKSVFRYIDHYEKDAYSSDYFAKREPGTEHIERRTREYIAAQVKGKTGRILDVGCGKAWVAQLFCPAGFEVVSMDISLRNTSKALKRFPFENHFAIVADAFNLPFKSNTFDYIVASEIIEHVHDPKTFIKNLFGILKPEGKLILTTPYKEKIQYSLCIHCNNPTPVHAHLHSFDEKILKSLYPDNDFKSWKSILFGNKILIHLRTHFILKYLNFKIWVMIDRLINMIYKVPARILVTGNKK